MKRMRILKSDGSAIVLDEETTARVLKLAKREGISPQAMVRKIMRKAFSEMQKGLPN